MANVATSSSADAADSTRNRKRQPTAPMSMPPTVGPILGANPSAMPAMPMAVPWRFSGKRVMAMVCTSGMRMPVATASSTRPTMSIGKFSARKSHSDPAR